MKKAVLITMGAALAGAAGFIILAARALGRFADDTNPFRDRREECGHGAGRNE